MSHFRDRLETLVLVLVAMHSIGVSITMLSIPHWVSTFGGWGPVANPFFVRQGGVFHLVLALGYLMEYFPGRGLRLVLTAKSIATVFLLSAWLLDPAAPWALLLAGISDGAMGFTLFLIRRRRPAGHHT